jgi:hypothetical protein
MINSAYSRSTLITITNTYALLAGTITELEAAARSDPRLAEGTQQTADPPIAAAINNRSEAQGSSAAFERAAAAVHPK